MGDNNNMQDRNVSLGHVISWALWAAVAALLLAGAVTGNLFLALTGCATSAAAATSTIRGYFCSHNRQMRNVFQAGEDHGRMRSL